MTTIFKKTLIITLLLAAAGALTSCLDEHARDRLDDGKAYSTATDLYVNAVGNLYNYIGGNATSQGLQGTYRGVYDYNTFTTDEAIIPIRGGNWYDGGFWQDLYLHQWKPSDGALQDTWNYLYKVVALCNSSLYTISRHSSLLTAAQERQYTAEVRAIRAMFYWYIMDLWGNVPLITSASQTLASAKQSPRSATFRFIVQELQEAEPLLPGARSNQDGAYYGRVTRPVVDFVLAKLMLNAEVYATDAWTRPTRVNGKDMRFTVDGQQLNAWQACVAYCNKLEAAGYTLQANRSANFAVNNETSIENIFTIPMDKTLYSNEFQYLFRTMHYAQGSAYGRASENGACATLATARAFGYGTGNVDSRWATDFFADTVFVDGQPVRLDDGSPLIYSPLAVQVNLTYSPYVLTAGARMAKYEVDRNAYNDGKLCNNDIVLFRYADAVLMRAEALVRNGESGQADLDAIRSRAGMPSRPATLDNILEERRLELAWEGWRRQDLVRYGRYASAYDLRPQLDGEASGYTTVFPIPYRATQLNTQLRQNPGY